MARRCMWLCVIALVVLSVAADSKPRKPKPSRGVTHQKCSPPEVYACERKGGYCASKKSKGCSTYIDGDWASPHPHRAGKGGKKQEKMKKLNVCGKKKVCCFKKGVKSSGHALSTGKDKVVEKQSASADIKCMTHTFSRKCDGKFVEDRKHSFVLTSESFGGCKRRWRTKKSKAKQGFLSKVAGALRTCSGDNQCVPDPDHKHGACKGMCICGKRGLNECKCVREVSYGAGKKGVLGAIMAVGGILIDLVTAPLNHDSCLWAGATPSLRMA